MSESTLLITKDMKRNLLCEIIQNAIRNEQPEIVIEAIHELNLMDGHHAPKKIDLTINGNAVEVSDVTQAIISDFDDDSNPH